MSPERAIKAVAHRQLYQKHEIKISQDLCPCMLNVVDKVVE